MKERWEVEFEGGKSVFVSAKDAVEAEVKATAKVGGGVVVGVGLDIYEPNREEF